MPSTKNLSESYIRIRSPERLVKALEKEAERRMTTKSALVRQALVRELRITEQEGDQE